MQGSLIVNRSIKNFKSFSYEVNPNFFCCCLLD